MGEVSNGPARGLPGFCYKLSRPCDCDNHAGRPAARRVQGETDSFGAEYSYLCQECTDHAKNRKHEGVCDHCDTWGDDLRPFRDPDEGQAGRVYYLCKSCKEVQRQAAYKLYEDEEARRY